MNINDKCIYLGTKGEVIVVILDKVTKLGPSIQNDGLQTMDLKLNTYYKIIYFNEEIWVTENFLKKID